MPTQDDVNLCAHNAVQARLKAARPNAAPWLNLVVGSDGGAGYGFSDQTLPPFIVSVYQRMKTAPELAAVSQIFDVPVLPIAELLGKNVSALEEFIASDVCGQIGL